LSTVRLRSHISCLEKRRSLCMSAVGGLEDSQDAFHHRASRSSGSLDNLSRGPVHVDESGLGELLRCLQRVAFEAAQVLACKNQSDQISLVDELPMDVLSVEMHPLEREPLYDSRRTQRALDKNILFLLTSLSLNCTYLLVEKN
jgi:hypothetical protein